MRKILFINTYYDRFLQSHSLDLEKGYLLNLKKRIDSRFGDSDFYSYWLNSIGWEAMDIIANDQILQQQWCEEKGFDAGGIIEICMLQILTYKPSIVYFQDISLITNDVASFLRAHGIKICGQHASPLQSGFDFRNVDLFVSSMPHLVDFATANGARAIYLPLAFDSRLLDETPPRKWNDRLDGGFVGGFTEAHTSGVDLILSALKTYPSLRLYGYGWENSLVALLNSIDWHGEVWGLDMFELIGSWKISLNRHIDISGMHANNMRLYESTGMGALLLSDKKLENQLFSSGIDFLEYENVHDLKEKISYLLLNPKEAEEIAKKGQKRTIENHSYEKRMVELSTYLSNL